MTEGLSRLAIRGVLIAFGTVITEGPIGRFVQSWSDTGARVAWSVLGAIAVALFYGSVVTAGHAISKVLLVGLGILALVMDIRLRCAHRGPRREGAQDDATLAPTSPDRLDMRLGALLFLCCVAAATTARAQNMVGGMAEDSATHSPLPCVEVTLEDTSGHPIGRTRTARDGYFQFDSPERGSYRFRFDAFDAAPLFSPVMSLDRDSAVAQRFVLAFGRPVRVTLTEPSDTAADAPVWPIPDFRGPEYPPDLRVREVEGEVLMQFVVDSTGAVDRTTVRVIRSTDRGFTQSVEQFLRRARFHSERREHRPVCSLVQMPFQFALSR